MSSRRNIGQRSPIRVVYYNIRIIIIHMAIVHIYRPWSMCKLVVLVDLTAIADRY